MKNGEMLTEHEFQHDGLRYRCVRGMTAPPIGHQNDTPRMAYWDVARSDAVRRRVWVPVGQEFDAAELEAAMLQEFTDS